MKRNMISILAGAALMLLTACTDDVEMRYPPKYELPDLPVVEGIHDNVKAPLYWSVYEYCYDQERQGVGTIDISPEEWDKIIDFVATNLKPHGYDMICTDGFIAMLATDNSGYMTQYGSISLKDLVAKCKAKGLKLGVYDNPLWIHGPRDTKIEGTDYTFGNLYYNGSTQVVNPGVDDMWFHWIVAENPGAKEYIDGFFKHYKELGVEFIRMDFLSWYEDGKDRGIGVVGRGYGRESYARAMAYIAESAKKYGIFTSLVMPHNFNDAEIEARYGNMMRIVCDTGGGGWWHTSAQDKGKSYANWPQCMNQFDGFTYWSHLSGRNKIILDGDFIRLNKFDTDAERETVISLQLMAGGPVAAADQYSTIGNNLKFYVNDELLALNKDGFVGKPLSDKLGDKKNEIWYGKMTNGDYVVGLFNRSDNTASVSVKLSDIGISGEKNVRDLWKHTDEGKASVVSANIPAHGCKIVKLSDQ
ncbi:glucan 1,6-alpha-isomaltosidase [Prevotella sp. P3-122]|uniref:alpha-galactosidase n=1 Tax=Prevotella sp. P3-122 TaxID=2024223 RepID=UPI000B974F3C|nr:glucan 1,6-alpha-isomaltosidase [Prevotella sp. P3-122]MCI7687796.1 glucan 1,6-alpha-isomaltosidase [Prevotella sp.]MDY3897333.1 glucan 1,6-alpha-isomaltosidase [Prevotella sp.]OYP60686.1 glucan 1,6-alpha-isomaltosidase [Prevotella sp. P3-122]